MAGEIDLRFSLVDPPAAEPKRSIYRDIVNLPDPVKLGMTVRYFNYDSVTLYFKVTGSGTGYTFGNVALGSLAAGTNAYINLDEFASRAKPAAATEEDVTVTLNAYTDSAYTNLKWTFSRSIHIVFIKSDDGTWTTDFSDNFDDGTVNGWAVLSEAGNYSGYPTIAVAIDYVLSPPYSCKMQMRESAAYAQVRSRLYKDFTTPNKNTIYAIFNVRVGEKAGTTYPKNLRLQNGDTILVYLGRPHDTVNTTYMATNKWLRVVIPLPKNVAVELRVVDERRGCTLNTDNAVWMDDFKIISK